MDIVLSLLLTAIAYMAFPLIKLLTNGGRFPKNRAHKIALWNSIVLGAVFCIATIAVSEDGTIWNGAPAVLYYWINRSILTDKNAQDEPLSKNQAEKAHKRKNIGINVLKGIGALFLSIISSEMLLMVIVGDSVEGSAALLLMFLVAIPFFVLYFWLFTRRSKKKEQSSNTPTYKETSSQPTTPAKITRPPQISYANEKPKNYGNYNVYGSDIALQTSPAPQSISFCRKCGSKLLDGSQFCHKCGTKAMLETQEQEKSTKTARITPIEKLVLLTVGLPAAIAEKSEEEMNIVKNQYAYCDAIIFAEFFIRANALELAPSREIAMKFSDSYIDAVIKETINTVPDTETFFADMFYSRATLYDGIVMNSKEPIMDVVEVLTHIIHKEIDDDNYVITDDRNYRYFGGIFENLAIKTELVSLFQCINDVTEDTMKELKDYLKTL